MTVLTHIWQTIKNTLQLNYFTRKCCSTLWFHKIILLQITICFTLCRAAFLQRVQFFRNIQNFPWWLDSLETNRFFHFKICLLPHKWPNVVSYLNKHFVLLFLHFWRQTTAFPLFQKRGELYIFFIIIIGENSPRN